MSSAVAQAVINAAKRQVKPLGGSPPEDDNGAATLRADFFSIIPKVWKISDHHGVNKEVSSTNFVMFGPQSAGKTTLVERILKFPVAIAREGMGTTRPMVLTTLQAENEGVWVRDEDDPHSEFEMIEKHQVMAWVCNRMQGPVKSSRLHIKVHGKYYFNRRFVDLPGFQMNAVRSGSNLAIENLLVEELKNLDTVVVCVEDSSVEFPSSVLVIAVNKILKSSWPQQGQQRHRFVVVLNKSDKWLEQGSVAANVFWSRLEAYVHAFDVVPILVGGSIDPGDESLRNARSRDDGTNASFAEIVHEYAGAKAREIAIYDTFFNTDTIKAEPGLAEFRAKCVGFDNFLGTVDALVVGRDLQNMPKLVKSLSNIANEKQRRIESLVRQQDIVEDIDKATRQFVGEIIRNTVSILSDELGNHAINVVSDPDVITAKGMTANQEEKEFLSSHYEREVIYRLFEHQLGSDTYDEPSKSQLDKWVETTKKTHIMISEKSRSGSIEYLHTPLLNGQVYRRAIAVWAVSAYHFLLPVKDDLKVLANSLGVNPFAASGEEIDVTKARVLAEVYIGRLAPGLHYLCQKIEFLMLNIFEIAWLSLMRKEKYRETATALGGDAFRTALKIIFGQHFRESASLAYNRSFFDLENEVYKIAPYGSKGPSVSAMKFAFEGDFEKRRDRYNMMSKGMIDEYEEQCTAMFSGDNPKSISSRRSDKNLLKSGIMFAIKILSTYGSIDPLLGAGLELVQVSVKAITTQLEKRSSNGQVTEESDQIALGYAVCMYCHFLPRFISSVDGRMRADMWACLHNSIAQEKIQTNALSTGCVTEANQRFKKNAKKIEKLRNQRKEILRTCQDLESFLNRSRHLANDADILHGGEEEHPMFTNNGNTNNGANNAPTAREPAPVAVANLSVSAAHDSSMKNGYSESSTDSKIGNHSIQARLDALNQNMFLRPSLPPLPPHPPPLPPSLPQHSCV